MRCRTRTRTPRAAAPIAAGNRSASSSPGSRRGQRSSLSPASWFGVPVFIVLSLLFVGGLVLFALATLPVEIGASQRALGVLRQTGLADAAEFGEIRRVLRAAALTYVVGILDRLGYFLVLLFVAEATRRVAT